MLGQKIFQEVKEDEQKGGDFPVMEKNKERAERVNTRILLTEELGGE